MIRCTMDPITHALSGASLAAARLRRATPMATSALVLGALAPDVDALVMYSDAYASLAHRRGLTHGVVSIVVLPLLLTPVLLLWDRHVRQRRRPDAAPANAGPLSADIGGCADAPGAGLPVVVALTRTRRSTNRATATSYASRMRAMLDSMVASAGHA